jgi:hypothetical protein
MRGGGKSLLETGADVNVGGQQMSETQEKIGSVSKGLVWTPGLSAQALASRKSRVPVDNHAKFNRVIKEVDPEEEKRKALERTKRYTSVRDSMKAHQRHCSTLRPSRTCPVPIPYRGWSPQISLSFVLTLRVGRRRWRHRRPQIERQDRRR